MEEVTSVSFFICRALYTPTEGPPKYSATNWGYSFSAFCSSFSISRMSLSFLPVLPVLNTGVMNISRVEPSCEKICSLISS